MSIRLRNKNIPDKWYIVVEGKALNKKGNIINQRLVKFDGPRSEALAADAELNGREIDLQYPTILEILPRFLDYYANNSQPKSVKSMDGALKHLLPFYGEMRIPLIARYHHEAYKSQRLAARYLPGKAWQAAADDTPEEAAKRRPLAKSSINRELACLKSILAWARKEKIIVESIPDTFSKRQSAGKEMVPLAPSQIKALLALIKWPHVITIMLMIYCGLRLKEATFMRCEDIHPANRTLYVLGKGGSRQPVEIPAPLLDPLKVAIGKRESGLLSENPKTGKPYGNIMKALNTFCKACGVTRHVSHHTLRHSCTTALVLAGVPLPVVQQKLRHSEVKTTMAYIHVAARFGTSVEPKIAREIFWLNEDGTQKEVQSGMQKITELSNLGALRPDTYPNQEACGIADGSTSKPA